MKNLRKLGEQLRYYLEIHPQLNSGEKLAKAINNHEDSNTRYTKSAVSRWENGIHRPPKNVVEIIEEILDVPENGLLQLAGYSDIDKERAKNTLFEDLQEMTAFIHSLIKVACPH